MPRAYMMTARRRAALRRAQLASARKRKKNGRINKKISKTRAKTRKRVAKHAAVVQRGVYTHSTQGGIYLNKRAVKAYKKGVKANARGQKKIRKLKAKRRR